MELISYGIDMSLGKDEIRNLIKSLTLSFQCKRYKHTFVSICTECFIKSEPWHVPLNDGLCTHNFNHKNALNKLGNHATVMRKSDKRFWKKLLYLTFYTISPEDNVSVLKMFPYSTFIQRTMRFNLKSVNLWYIYIYDK